MLSRSSCSETGIGKPLRLRPLGETPAVQAAVEQKVIAGMLTTVKPRIAARPLVNAADLDIPYPMSIIGVTQTFLQANRETLDRLLRAYVKGVAMMVQDKELVMKVLGHTCVDLILAFSMNPTLS
jgi:hypothetical protein